VILSKEELISLLRFAIERIEEDDSAEGSLQYEWAPDMKYNVGAFLRYDNQNGQGCSCVVPLEEVQP